MSICIEINPKERLEDDLWQFWDVEHVCCLWLQLLKRIIQFRFDPPTLHWGVHLKHQNFTWRLWKVCRTNRICFVAETHHWGTAALQTLLLSWGASPPHPPSFISNEQRPSGHDTCTMIILKACTTIIVHARFPVSFTNFTLCMFSDKSLVTVSVRPYGQRKNWPCIKVFALVMTQVHVGFVCICWVCSSNS